MAKGSSVHCHFNKELFLSSDPSQKLTALEDSKTLEHNNKVSKHPCIQARVGRGENSFLLEQRPALKLVRTKGREEHKVMVLCTP